MRRCRRRPRVPPLIPIQVPDRFSRNGARERRNQQARHQVRHALSPGAVFATDTVRIAVTAARIRGPLGVLIPTLLPARGPLNRQGGRLSSAGFIRPPPSTSTADGAPTPASPCRATPPTPTTSAGSPFPLVPAQAASGSRRSVHAASCGSSPGSRGASRKRGRKPCPAAAPAPSGTRP